MSGKLDRLKKLPGAEVEVDYKHIKIDGFSELIQEIKNIAASAEASRQEFIETIKGLSKIIIENKSEEDAEKIISAIQNLEIKVVETEKPTVDYTVEFDRDHNGLMKSGIRFSSIQPNRKH